MITLKHMQTESHHIKQDQTDTFVDVDEALTEHIQQEAIAHQSSAQNKSEQAELDRQADFDDLFPSEKRLAIERHYTPIIQKLATQHEELCDKVADFEDNQTRYRTDLAAQFAYELKHPDVKTVICAGDHHLNEMIKAGGLHIEGYKLVEKRSLGGLIQMVNDVKVATPGSSRLVYIPVTVESLMSYAHSPEARSHAQDLYEAELQRLIARRKKTAVELTEAKQKARNALAAIPTFEQLISDQVKKSAAKK
ncbi:MULTISPECIES: hypothetical protein [Pantoea]|uniref:hypothetical protein n=1 Tax=Pantoea TaxID=53335 RepID=UPI00257AACB5|nr:MULTISPECIES: hypothetical protein [Pantoea]MDU4747636.1 hypothetical protein [Pantoea sp.]